MRMRSQLEDFSRVVPKQLAWLMRIRLVIIIVISISIGIMLFRGGSESIRLWVLAWLIITSYIFTFICYWIVEKLEPVGLQRLTIAQLIWDIFLTTALIYVTGSAESSFVLLYHLTIFLASVMLGRMYGYRIAFTCALFLITLLALEYYEVIPSMLGEVKRAENLFSTLGSFSAVFLHLTIFLLTAYVSGELAERYRVSQISAEANKIRFEALTDFNQVILDNIANGIISITADGTIMTMNRAAQRMLGRGSSQVRVIDDIMPGTLARIQEFSFSEDVSMQRVLHFEEYLNHHSGRELCIAFSVSCLVDQGYVVALQDLTRAKQLESEIKVSERLAAVGKLASGIAHEIRNPLASISGSVEMLKDESQDQQNKRLLSIVVDETQRLNKMISEFLDFARPNEPMYQRLDIRKLIEDMADLTHSNKDVDIELHCDEGCSVNADPTQVRQVLWNLVNNARDAMAGRRGTVEIKVARSEGAIHIDVSDQGGGIDANTKQHIFDPFFTTKEHGSGLGLATAAKIMEAHGGSLTLLHTEPERGSTFRLTFNETSKQQVA